MTAILTESSLAPARTASIQHEIDHLDGIMFTDLVSPIKLDMAKKKVKTNLKKMNRVRIPPEAMQQGA